MPRGGGGPGGGFGGPGGGGPRGGFGGPGGPKPPPRRGWGWGGGCCLPGCLMTVLGAGGLIALLVAGLMARL